MPTYEYKCQRCGKIFEKFQNIKEQPLRSCPNCRGRVKRMIGTGAGIIFKGSGFYSTDYRSQSYKEHAKKEKELHGGKSESKSTSTHATKSKNPEGAKFPHCLLVPK